MLTYLDLFFQAEHDALSTDIMFTLCSVTHLFGISIIFFYFYNAFVLPGFWEERGAKRVGRFRLNKRIVRGWWFKYNLQKSSRERK